VFFVGRVLEGKEVWKKEGRVRRKVRQNEVQRNNTRKGK
jgi:hypothetical protein